MTHGKECRVRLNWRRESKRCLYASTPATFCRSSSRKHRGNMLAGELIPSLENRSGVRAVSQTQFAAAIAGNVGRSSKQGFIQSFIAPKRIGQRLYISTETVKAHMKHIMEKLGASDRTQAMAIAARRGIIQL